MKLALSPSSRALRPSPLRKRIAWALAIAVLLVQTLGALHRVSHADPARSATAGQAVASAGGHDFLQTLFSGHAGSKDCDAYDQMSQGSAAVASVTALAAAPLPLAAETVHPAWHIAAQARGFLARGPPATA